jgi:hypothetical protein
MRPLQKKSKFCHLTPSVFCFSIQPGLTRDNSEGITAIDWTVYGKVNQVTKTTGNVNYLYDASGQRVAKTVGGVATQPHSLAQKTPSFFVLSAMPTPGKRFPT